MLHTSLERTDDRVPLDGSIFYIVGNRFSEFADNNTILTISQAHDAHEILSRISSCIVISQGVSKQDAEELKKKIESWQPRQEIEYVDRTLNRAAMEQVHKYEQKNVLITTPERIEELRFTSHLSIDDSCSEMSDHQTGEHIQGAILIEAARQLFMACVLTYDVASEFRRKVQHIQFTLSEMDIRYENFIFPVDAQLDLSISNININGSTANGRAEIKIYQFGKCCSTVKFKASAYSKKFLSSLEKRCSRKVKIQLLSPMPLSEAS